MRGGSDTEINSGLGREDADIIKQAPGIRVGRDGKPMASAEMMIIAELLRGTDTKDAANITVRGVEPDGLPAAPAGEDRRGAQFHDGIARADRRAGRVRNSSKVPSSGQSRADARLRLDGGRGVSIG